MEDERQPKQQEAAARPPPPCLYRTPAGQQACADLYAQALAALPYLHEERLVPTSFGTAHVTICGKEGAPPLVVWHGMGAPAPFILRMFDEPPLVDHFRMIFCPDLPYHAGSRSQDAELDWATHEHGRWCLEVLQGLGLAAGSTESGTGRPGSTIAAALRPPFHIGVSFGAAVLLDLAAVAPAAVRAAALVVPGGLMPGSTWSIMLRLVLPSMLYRLLPCRWTSWLSLAAMCDEPDGDLEFVKLSWRHVCRYAQLPGGPAGFTADQLQHFSAPTLAITAEFDLFWPGRAAAEAARRLLPGCQAVVIPGARHLPSKNRMVEVNRQLLEFFKQHEQ